MLLTSFWQIDIAICLSTGLYIVYLYFNKKHQYWQKRGVFTSKPLPIIGNVLDPLLFRTTLAEWTKDQYDAADKDLDYFGIYIFDKPYLAIKNPKLFKHVLIKDFSHFSNRSFANPDHSPFMKHLMFFQKNPKWKNDRHKLTPTFSSGKIKKMFHLMVRSSTILTGFLEKNQSNILDAKDLAAMYSTNVISKCAFGIDSDSFEEKSIFIEKVQDILKFTWRNAFAQHAYFLNHSLVSLLKLEFVKKDLQEYFSNIFLTAFKTRKDTERYDDLIDIMKDLIKSGDSTFDSSDIAICGIAFIFFLGGYETTSSVIGYTLYELVKNRSLQDKLRKDINRVLEQHGGFTYECIQEMQYLENCIYETIRKYPVAPFLDRVCEQDYKIPGTDLVIEKGVTVLFPVYGLHMDEKYFSDPHRYDPHRFDIKRNKDEGDIFLPFGAGPRNCIGQRFGKISTTLALASILKDFELLECDETPKEVKFDPRSFLLHSTVGLPIKFKKL